MFCGMNVARSPVSLSTAKFIYEIHVKQELQRKDVKQNYTHFSRKFSTKFRQYFLAVSQIETGPG
jgi:hypothetical protein